MEEKTKNIIEKRRSLVRIVLSFWAGALLSVIVVWNLATPPIQEGIIAQVSTICGMIIAFWFGQRGKENEK